MVLPASSLVGCSFCALLLFVYLRAFCQEFASVAFRFSITRLLSWKSPSVDCWRRTQNSLFWLIRLKTLKRNRESMYPVLEKWLDYVTKNNDKFLQAARNYIDWFMTRTQYNFLVASETWGSWATGASYLAAFQTKRRNCHKELKMQMGQRVL